MGLVAPKAPGTEEKPFTLNPDQKRFLKAGTTIASFWKQEFPADIDTIANVEQAIKSVNMPSLLSKNTMVECKFDKDKTPLELTWRPVKDKKLTLKRGVDNHFFARVVDDLPTEQTRVISGTIYSNFISAAQNAGLPLSLVDDFVDLLGDRVDFRKDLQPGDVFAIILRQKQYSDGAWGEAMDIAAASIINNGKLKAVVRYRSNSGTIQSYNENGEPLGSYFLKYPLQFSRISSVFSDSRMHPVLGFARPHNGVDFAAPIGTPVRTIGEGKVEKAGFFGESGYMVKISHSSRWSTAYLHLSKIAPNVKAGATVARGQLIGAVGITGLSTGPHLHFSLYDNGKYVDPMSTKLPNVLNAKDLASPKIIQASLDTMKNRMQSVAYAANGRVSSRRG